MRQPEQLSSIIISSTEGEGGREGSVVELDSGLVSLWGGVVVEGGCCRLPSFLQGEGYIPPGPVHFPAQVSTPIVGQATDG